MGMNVMNVMDGMKAKAGVTRVRTGSHESLTRFVPFITFITFIPIPAVTHEQGE